MKRKISIITIVYMVDMYLRQCIESILAQSYDNFELILVLGQKDGKAVDGCIDIAKEYAEKDERIKLVFCEAKGPADARNKGLEAVTGELLGFVDSDDYIEKDMFETMVKNMEENNAQISICGRFYEFENITKSDSGKLEIMNSSKALETVLSDTGFFLHCWDKLFTKEVFEGLYFPIDNMVEDRIVVDKLLEKAETIVYDPTPKYHFRERYGSVSKAKGFAKYNAEANEQLTSFIYENHPELKDICGRFYLYETITCLQNILVEGIDDIESKKLCKNRIISILHDEKDNPLIDKKLKLKAFMAVRLPFLLRLITIKNKNKTEAVLKRFP